MKHTKNIALIVSLLMLCTAFLPLLSLAEQQAGTTELRGLVTEIVEGGFIMEDVNLGTVLLNVDPETVLEGMLAEKPLEKGMYVLVKCNGIFTRSDPPQTHADRLGCYPLEGTVSEILDDGILLTGDPIFGEVIVHLTNAMPHVFLGVPLTVYYDGAMAMSLPGKVVARHVTVPVVTGTIDGIEKESFKLVAVDGETYTVLLSGKTLLPASWFDDTLKGKKVIVYHNGAALDDGSLNALEVVDPSRITEESEPLEGIPTEEAALEETSAPSETDDLATDVPSETEMEDSATEAPSETETEDSATDAPSETETEPPSETPAEPEPTEEGPDNTEAPDESQTDADGSAESSEAPEAE